jgi:drug/metabolite transporter (DMT)-like permease
VRRAAALTPLALISFSANSLLCRLALGGGTIDAASFTTIRLAAGAATLAAISMAGSPGTRPELPAPRWGSSIALFLYAITFSLAYVSLTTGTGALLLFGAVQTTMLVYALMSGERPSAREWTGLGLAIVGLVYLVSPGLSAPPLTGSVLMLVSGVSWGYYSLWGSSSSDPLADTGVNFVRSVPMAAAVSALAIQDSAITPAGAGLAALSGAVASGLGYVAWYAALRGLTATRAATVQLAVPAVTAAGGVLLLGEPMSLRLVIAATLILGGVSLARR